MANITHDSPVVTEDKLKDFYEDIKPFLGCPAYVTQEGDSEYYSTDEKVIGRWVDGKPLYQKTFVYNDTVTCNQVTATVQIANITSLNVDTVVDLKGRFFSSGGNQERIFNNIAPVGGTASDIQKNMVNTLYVSADTHLLQLQTRRDEGTITMSKIVAIMKYTKTTDSAATTIEQKPTHYSTDEQVVGTWIDGKPIYQKTFTGNLSTITQDGVTVSTIIDTQSLNIAKCIGWSGYLYNDNKYFNPLDTCWLGTNITYIIHTYYNSDTNELSILTNRITLSQANYYITVQYIKTTD